MEPGDFRLQLWISLCGPMEQPEDPCLRLGAVVPRQMQDDRREIQIRHSVRSCIITDICMNSRYASSGSRRLVQQDARQCGALASKTFKIRIFSENAPSTLASTVQHGMGDPVR